MSAGDRNPTTLSGPGIRRLDLYWRPGCGFCSSLQRRLDAAGIERVEHNIWEDPAAAAIVRSVANGNETVPTVVVGGVGMVNPSFSQLTEHLAEHAPELLPADFTPEERGPIRRAIDRLTN